MKTAGFKGTGIVGPPGSGPKYRLEGDSHTLTIIHAGSRDGADHPESPKKLVIVQYPDGFERHHEVQNVTQLLSQIDQQLKGRYNLKSYTLTKVPAELKSGEEIITGDNVHDA